ncbi:MAG: hypothetical protein IJ523_09345 [Succinivibrionaceae bacterium]|nr:hypothetical protein [Succinivibrionaceae bacterium]
MTQLPDGLYYRLHPAHAGMGMYITKNKIRYGQAHQIRHLAKDFASHNFQTFTRVHIFSLRFAVQVADYVMIGATIPYEPVLHRIIVHQFNPNLSQGTNPCAIILKNL